MNLKKSFIVSDKGSKRRLHLFESFFILIFVMFKINPDFSFDHSSGSDKTNDQPFNVPQQHITLQNIGLIIASRPTPEAIAMGKAIGNFLLEFASAHLFLRNGTVGDRILLKALSATSSIITIFSSPKSSIDKHENPDFQSVISFRKHLKIEIILELPENDTYLKGIESNPHSILTGAIDWPARFPGNAGNRYLIERNFSDRIRLMFWKKDLERMLSGIVQRSGPRQLHLGI